MTREVQHVRCSVYAAQDPLEPVLRQEQLRRDFRLQARHHGKFCACVHALMCPLEPHNSLRPGTCCQLLPSWCCAGHPDAVHAVDMRQEIFYKLTFTLYDMSTDEVQTQGMHACPADLPAVQHWATLMAC